MAHAVSSIAERLAAQNGARKPEVAAPDWVSRLSVTDKGKPRGIAANVMLYLQHCWPRGTLVWDGFTDEPRTTRRPPWDPDTVPPSWEPGPWTVDDDVRTGAWLARHQGVQCGDERIRAAVNIVAQMHRVHPVQDWLASLQWDGAARVDDMLARYFGVAPGAYASAVSRMVLIGAVARVCEPGSKLDTMLVLEGPQGIGKSTGLKTLVGDEWYSDTPLDLANKDRFVALRGKWGIEIAELDGFDRHEVTRIKSFVSSPVDTYRPPYGRGDVRFPRQCFFVGTTNASEYLRDVTGNRRFYPVRCGKIDLLALERDREQLWAESVVRFSDGVRWWPDSTTAKLCADEQAQRVVVDSWEDSVRSYVVGRTWVTVAEVLSHALDIEPARHTQAEQNRVARALVKAGWTRKQRRVNGTPTWGYVTSESEVVT